MDRKMIADHLALAERHVEQGERHLAQQRELIERLARQGHATSEAVNLLASFEELQSSHVADRDRLRNELKEATPISR